MTHNPIPLNIAEEAFEIDPNTPSGLRWKTRPRHHFSSSHACNQINSKYAGKSAGTERKSNDGAIRYFVCLCFKKFNTARIVYALHKGVDPASLEIDHIDGNSVNNNPLNLRAASRAENARNRGPNRGSKSGHIGVTWAPRERKWVASVAINRKRVSCGYYDNLEDAIKARVEAEVSVFGEFAPSLSRVNSRAATFC